MEEDTDTELLPADKPHPRPPISASASKDSSPVKVVNVDSSGKPSSQVSNWINLFLGCIYSG